MQPAVAAYSVAAGQPVHGGRWPGGRLYGGPALDDARPGGALSMLVSQAGGGVTLDDARPGGALLGVYVPSWAAATPVGEWGVVTNLSLVTGGAAWSGTFPGGIGTGYRNVIDAWSGAVLTPVGAYAGNTWLAGPTMLYWGGGHADYAGNEIYALHLNTDSPAWYRLRDPTIPAPVNVAQTSDGDPVSRHTYDACAYVGTSGRNVIVAPGGMARFSDSASDGSARQYNLSQPDANGATSPWTVLNTPLSYVPQTVAFDAATNRVWGYQISSNSVHYFDLNTNAQVAATFKSPNVGTNPISDIDANRGIWMILSMTTLQAFRINDIGNNYYTPSTTGTQPSGNAGFLWDSADDVFRSWNGGKTIWTLTPPASSPYQGGNAWTWSSVTPAGGATPPAAPANGVYGRFATVSFGPVRGYILTTSSDSPTYFYRTA